MATIRGRVVDPQGASIGGASVRLLHPENPEPMTLAQSDGHGNFVLRDVPAGSYIVLTSSAGFRQRANGVRVESVAADLSAIELPLGLISGDVVCSLPCEIPPPPPIPVLTVCEAFDRRDPLSYQRVVIVGIFKSGMDETLRLDCPTQLASGDVGWPSAIGLTRPSQPPESLRDEIEKKRQEVIKSSPPEAPLRPERVVGLYGVFVSLAGLTAQPCCKAPIETVLPPARLFGMGATDLRVIR